MYVKQDLKSAGKVVLIVDDDRAVLEITSRLLSAAGYQTVEATTPAQAIGLAALVKIDILLVDAVLPDMSGPDLVEELSKLQVFETTVLMSGLDSLEVWMACGRPCQVLQKPFSRAELLGKVEMTGAVSSAG